MAYVLKNIYSYWYCLTVYSVIIHNSLVYGVPGRPARHILVLTSILLRSVGSPDQAPLVSQQSTQPSHATCVPHTSIWTHVAHVSHLSVSHICSTLVVPRYDSLKGPRESDGSRVEVPTAGWWTQGGAVALERFEAQLILCTFKVSGNHFLDEPPW